MRKMAADFLDSNLFNPTAPSEQSLKEARLRRVHLGERNKWRLSKNEAETRMQPRKGLSHFLRNGLQSDNNNTDYAGDQPPKRIPESSDETFLKEGVPIEVLLHSTNLRQMQKDLMKYDLHIDTYCKDVVREKMRTRIENLRNPSVPLSIIEEDKEAQTDIQITEEIKISETMASEESSEGTSLYQDSHASNLSYAQKNLLYKLHYLFNANSRRSTKEDKILLVRESNSELDLHQPRDSPASNSKIKNELRYFLVKRIQNLWHKWLKEKNKEAILVEVSAPEKKKKKKEKKKRLRKKNVYRTGRRLGKSIVRSLVSMSYASPTSYYRGYLIRERSFDTGSVRGPSNPKGSSWGCGSYPI